MDRPMAGRLTRRSPSPSRGGGGSKLRMDRKPGHVRITDPSHPAGKRKEIDNVMRKARAFPNETWDKKLLEAEEKDPNRWRHTGFKKMYIEEDGSSSDSDSGQRPPPGRYGNGGGPPGRRSRSRSRSPLPPPPSRHRRSPSPVRKRRFPVSPSPPPMRRRPSPSPPPERRPRSPPPRPLRRPSPPDFRRKSPGGHPMGSPPPRGRGRMSPLPPPRGRPKRPPSPPPKDFNSESLNLKRTEPTGDRYQRFGDFIASELRYRVPDPQSAAQIERKLLQTLRDSFADIESDDDGCYICHVDIEAVNVDE